MTLDIAREDCHRCNGTGQIIREEFGHTGYVPCDECDNIPAYQLPNDIPDDPETRITDINEELQQLEDRKEQWEHIRGLVSDIQDNYREIIRQDVLPDNTAHILGFFDDSLDWVMHHQNIEYGLSYQKEQLRDEREKLQHVIELLEDQTDA